MYSVAVLLYVPSVVKMLGACRDNRKCLPGAVAGVRAIMT